MPFGSGAIVVHRMLEKRLPGYHTVGYSPYLEFAPPLLRLLVPRPDADVIHTTPDHAIFFQRTGIPLVLTFHNLVIDEFMHPYSSKLQWFHYRTDLRWFLKRSLKVANMITAVSRFTADLATRELGCGSRIEVIPNGVDIDRFRPAPDRERSRKLRLLFAGNPSFRKGAQWLPAIADQLSEGDHIICATGLRGRWQSYLNHPRIEVLGGVKYEDMPRLYQSVDALLLPTVREGDSLVVLEAMSSGLPVIATNCSSLSERVGHGQGGFLCRLGHVGDFVNAIETLRSVELRLEMGCFNRERALSEFSVDRMTSQYEEIFRRVV